MDRSALRYPWLAGEPALNRDFSYEDYAREARRGGITDALHMEVDVDPGDIEAEIDYAATKAREENSLLRGAIASCRPEEPGFAAYLERQQANPFVKGFRRVLHVVPDDVSEGALFRENIRRLSGTGLTFDLVVLPRQIPKAIALADLAPDVQFVLDHCGVPDIKGACRTSMAGASSRKSPGGPMSSARSPAWLPMRTPTIGRSETLRPYVEHTIGAFGWDRVVWGSDWPVCTLGGGLSTWLAATHALLAGTSAEEKAKLLSGNARRIWSLA